MKSKAYQTGLYYGTVFTQTIDINVCHQLYVSTIGPAERFAEIHTKYDDSVLAAKLGVKAVDVTCCTEDYMVAMDQFELGFYQAVKNRVEELAPKGPVGDTVFGHKTIEKPNEWVN